MGRKRAISGSKLGTTGLQTNSLAPDPKNSYSSLIAALITDRGVNGMIEHSDNWAESVGADVVRTVFERMRPTSGLTPSPGFYERVRRRIEEIECQSIWAPFIYSRVPIRLASSFLVLSFIVLGYVLATEANANDDEGAFTGATSGEIFNGTNVQQQRDAVLRQIGAYRTPD
jgi:hypothetical protein